MLTLGRTVAEPFEDRDIQHASSVARVVGAVLERDSLHVALKERKLVERAKGIVQQRRGISEADAYLLLRNQSRHLRRPMAIIAEEIISESLLRKTA